MRPSCIDVLGKVVETVKCRSSALEGVRGVVVGDRRNSLEILTEKGARVVVPKEMCWFYVYYDSCIRMIYGRWILGYRDVRLYRRECSRRSVRAVAPRRVERPKPRSTLR